MTDIAVTETSNEGLKRAYRIVIPAASIEAKIDAAARDAARQIKMPGFRPGKVPLNLVRKMHGASLRGEAVERAAQEGVERMMAEHRLRPAMQPEVALDPEGGAEGDVALTVAVEVLPDIPAPNIDGIALERLTVEPDEAAVDASLKRFADQQKGFTPAPEDHAAAVGDIVVMDFAGTVDGEPFDGGKGEGMQIELGSGRLIPGFEDQLVGIKAGEDRTINVTFPDDYPTPYLKGRDAVFAVTVEELRIANQTPIDDTLATNLGLESLAQLRDILKDQVESELAGMSRTHLKRKLLDRLAATHDFAVPETMVDAEFGQIWGQLEREAANDPDAEGAKAKIEQERDEYRRIAERRVRLGLLLSEIGQSNGVTVTAAETQRLIQEEARRNRGREAEVTRYFQENPGAAAQLRAPLFEEKVVDFLLTKAEVTERMVTREELQAAIEDEDESPFALPMSADGIDPVHVHGPDCDHDHD